MSFFRKAWKSIKGAFKSVGKGIKSAVTKVGKFMDKIGIVGQIGLMFILPGVGAFLAKGLGTMTAAMAASTNSVLAGAGKVLQTVGKFANTAGNAYKTVTDAVSGFVSNVGKGMVNKTGTLLGRESLLIPNAPATVSEGFGNWMTGVADDVSNITSPFRAPALAVEDDIAKGFTSNIEIEDFDAYDPSEAFKSPNQDFKFYEVPRDSYMNVVEQETKGWRKFVGEVGTYAKDTMMSLPERAIDTTADVAVDAVETAALNATGVQTQPTYNSTTNVTNIPQFRSNPIQASYETSGVNYGATPESRLQYYAATQPFGDFGATGFNTYAGMRVR